ncbi:MAG: ATP-binding protein [Pseudomonadota bacterium]
MRLSFRAKVNLVLGAGLALLFAIGAGSYSTIDRLMVETRSESAVQDSFILLERIVSNLKSSESFQRKYLITSTAEDLQEYLHSREMVLSALGAFRNNPAKSEQTSSVTSLIESVQSRMDLLDEAVRVRQTSGLGAARPIVDSEFNRRLRDEIDGLVDRLKAEEGGVLQAARQETKRSAKAAERLLISGGILSLVFFLWAIYIVNRYEGNRKRAAAELSRSEAMSRAVTEGMAEGVITSTTEGYIVWVNEAAEKLFGYTRAELEGAFAGVLLPERFRPTLPHVLSALVARPPHFREFGREAIGRRKDGSEFPSIISFGDVNTGEQRFFSAIIRDDTERKRISKELRSSERQLRELTNNVPALIAYIDSAQCFRLHNKACEELLGLSHERIHDQALSDVFGPVLYAGIKTHVDEVLAGFPVRFEQLLVTQGGDRRDFDLNFYPRFGDGKLEHEVIGFFAMGSDITEFKRVDRMKTEFVSTVSHELRTPLTSIRGSLGLIAGGVAGQMPGPASKLIDVAMNNCERLIRLINDILDSEKIESGKIHFDLLVHDVKDVVQLAISANEGFAEQHNVKLRLKAPREPLRATVDADRLIQVITNLLSNAIKFSPPDGAVEIHLAKTDHVVRVEVRDSGPGIPEVFRKRIFQKFSQADSSDTRKKGGTGLGLNISRAIIELMGGTIGFASERGMGSVFHFELPLWREPEAVHSTSKLTSIRPNVLVCEPDPDISRLVGKMLHKAGFDVDAVHSGSLAQHRLETGHYEALLLGLDKDGPDRQALIAALRENPLTRKLPMLPLAAQLAQGQLKINGLSLAIDRWMEFSGSDNPLVTDLWRTMDGLYAQRPRILRVEAAVDSQRIATAVSQGFATFEFAATLDEARYCLRSREFDLVLLDVSLGDTSGWDLMPDIRGMNPRPAVVVLSPHELSPRQTSLVSAVLIKDQTSDALLLATLQRVLGSQSSYPDPLTNSHALSA